MEGEQIPVRIDWGIYDPGTDLFLGSYKLNDWDHFFANRSFHLIEWLDDGYRSRPLTSNYHDLSASSQSSLRKFLKELTTGDKVLYGVPIAYQMHEHDVTKKWYPRYEASLLLVDLINA